MGKEVNYYNIAGELQTKAMQFSSLGSYANAHGDAKEQALKYINDIMFTLREYKKVIKKELLKEEHKQ